MERKAAESALGASAMALETELQRFEQAAADARAQRLDSAKNLDRGAAQLSRAAEVETRLGARVAALIEAIRGADARQRETTEALKQVGERLHARQLAYAELVEGFAQIGRDAAAVGGQLDGGKEGLQRALDEIEALDVRTEELIQRALSEGFQDLAAEARSRRQQLQSLLGGLGRMH